ncbi:MAG TPA: hypothetical protein VLT36_15730, partial [Candidatus Dormibacteraeota bacterium]|nr:hypothetical protein [Candidatus Dormibacteraeota bacterium]
MPFNPALPANNSPVSSSELRDQFTGLKDYVDDVANDLNMNIGDAVTNNAAGPVQLISELALTVSNPPTQAQMQQVVDKL